MPKASRRGDLCTGHDKCAPRPAIQGSPDVSLNDRAALRKGDAFVPHGCPGHTPHSTGVSRGSSSVSINDRDAARVGDPFDCGSHMKDGSDDVEIGD